MIANAKHLAVLLPSLLCAITALPASAGTILYDQFTQTIPGVVSGSFNVGVRDVFFQESVTDAFTLSQASVVDSAVFALWVEGSGTVTSLDWAITTLPFGGVTEASGTASNLPNTLQVMAPAYGPGGNIYLETLSFSNLSLAAGTHWLQLGHAVNSFPDPQTGLGIVGWDDAFTSIAGFPPAFQNNGQPNSTHAAEAQTFQINGPGTPSSTAPEPSSFLLLGTVLAGLVGFMRPKLLV